MKELRRVLKPKGRLFLTVPYGIHRDYGLFQQFDHALHPSFYLGLHSVNPFEQHLMH
jgi:hypothetical protein